LYGPFSNYDVLCVGTTAARQQVIIHWRHVKK